MFFSSLEISKSILIYTGGGSLPRGRNLGFFLTECSRFLQKFIVAACLAGKLRKMFVNKGKRHFHTVSVLQN